ncbi:transcriptional modulator of MazE/toxin, MazF [Desulfonatronospira thiodismutans ASO3-1]|uniref:mRNA interferase n=1 Tax=Desulfonatronospira thiodismutans ASO3-1 TaxID=555779 RepID=D6STC4_9BACT|nr:type II toxin-antitoxin system PemK/MazF family toxin [Desulfonatronospira thiodismutans]EFI33940.1 transcriptional modulator of MazE/toxin, MazF [Desulfonatronospira thiodismutans ASO3-1]
MRQVEIWEIDLNPTIGSEIKKKRPAVIINNDSIGILPLKVIVPVTEWKDSFEGAIWLVKIVPDSDNNLMKLSAVDTFQIRSVSTKRFLVKTGSVSSRVLEEIKTAVKAVVDG